MRGMYVYVRLIVQCVCVCVCVCVCRCVDFLYFFIADNSITCSFSHSSHNCNHHNNHNSNYQCYQIRKSMGHVMLPVYVPKVAVKGRGKKRKMPSPGRDLEQTFHATPCEASIIISIELFFFFHGIMGDLKDWILLLKKSGKILVTERATSRFSNRISIFMISSYCFRTA